MFIRDKPIISSERILHTDYYRKGSVEKMAGRWPEGALCEGELISGEPPVVK
jgi:hypothetical protein